MKTIKVLDFTSTPWPRYISQWSKSWEEFFETILKPFFDENAELLKHQKVVIDLDWTKGYPSSFLSESFWRLYKKLNDVELWKNIEFISNDVPSHVDFINRKAPQYGTK